MYHVSKKNKCIKFILMLFLFYAVWLNFVPACTIANNEMINGGHSARALWF